ncbi:MAG TPA: hypothetical protein VFW26_03445 [Gaiellales bacterium]|nr:hypothetical protein [Gaiellales bacterium]
MLSVVEIFGVIVAVCLIAVGLWPGPWRLNTGTAPRDDDRINAIKEAIDILQQELADLEAVEHEARVERLVPALTTP